jgi:hypothetical protein
MGQTPHLVGTCEGELRSMHFAPKLLPTLVRFTAGSVHRNTTRTDTKVLISITSTMHPDLQVDGPFSITSHSATSHGHTPTLVRNLRERSKEMKHRSVCGTCLSVM